jgi:hypothetical protein
VTPEHQSDSSSKKLQVHQSSSKIDEKTTDLSLSLTQKVVPKPQDKQDPIPPSNTKQAGISASTRASEMP